MESVNEVRFLIKEATRFPAELVDQVMIYSRRALRAVIRIQAAIRAFRPRALFSADMVNFYDRDDLKFERYWFLQSKSYQDWSIRTGTTLPLNMWKNRRWKDLMLRSSRGNYLMTHDITNARAIKGSG